jgi:hypothetical protein
MDEKRVILTGRQSGKTAQMLQAAYDENYLLRQKLAKSEARVADLAAKAHNLSFGIVNSLTDEQQEPFAKQFAELQDCIAAQSSEPYILRKQAEAVEHYREALGMWLKELPGNPCASFVEGIISSAEQANRHAQRLRQQADEAERAGGEQ